MHKFGISNFTQRSFSIEIRYNESMYDSFYKWYGLKTSYKVQLPSDERLR